MAKKIQKYRVEYSNEFPELTKSKISDLYIYCMACRKDFTISHGGRDDCRRHVDSPTHKKNKELFNKTSSIAAFISSKASQGDLSVIKAETLFVNALVEHNISFAVADHFNDLFRAMFPDSEIAKKFACRRTKTSAIVEKLAENLQTELAESLQSSAFSLCTDGGSDHKSQSYPMIVRYFDGSSIKTLLLDFPEMQEASSTGKHIFDLINSCFTKYHIPWENCIAFGTDNASVMTGRNAGVIAFLRQKFPDIFLSGCPCHLLHHAAEKAAAQLPLDATELLVDLFYFIQKHHKRMKELKEFQKLLGVEDHSILRHVGTRWLSLKRGLQRLLEQWAALTQYFRTLQPEGKKRLLQETSSSSSKKSMNSTSSSTKVTESSTKGKLPSDSSSKGKVPSDSSSSSSSSSKPSDEPKTKAEKLYSILSSDLNHLLCSFLFETVDVFVDANVFLQKDEPLIHCLRRSLVSLLTDIAVCFLKPSAIASCHDITKVNLDRKSQKSRDELVIGMKTKRMLEELRKDSKKWDKNDEDTFFCAVRAFYVAGMRYILQNIPVGEPLFKHAEVADIQLRHKSKFEDVEYFVKRFPMLIGGLSDEKLGKLQKQFLKYQVDPDLPSDLCDGTTRVDRAWAFLGSVKDTIGQPKYDLLARVMLGLLTIPHSNAYSERIFSAMKLTRSDVRSTMSQKMLGSALVLKQSMVANEKKCFQMNFTQKELRVAKSATVDKLSKSEAEKIEEDEIDKITGRVMAMLHEDHDDAACSAPVNH